MFVPLFVFLVYFYCSYHSLFYLIVKRKKFTLIFIWGIKFVFLCTMGSVLFTKILYYV